MFAELATKIDAAGIEVRPVPPLATGSVPATLDVRLQYAVDELPVPPFAIGKIPLTLLVKLQ